MICIPEFASWIRITNRRLTGPIVVIAYARYGANHTLQPVPSRFDCFRRSDTCELQSFGGRYFDDCPAAQTIEEPKPRVEPAPPVGKFGDIVGTVGWVQGAQASTTADVTVTGGKTAGVAKATVF